MLLGSCPPLVPQNSSSYIVYVDKHLHTAGRELHYSTTDDVNFNGDNLVELQSGNRGYMDER